MRAIVSLVVVLGCSSPHPPVSAPREAQPPAAAPKVTDMERARGYELGRPTRDYAAAARIYEQRCGDGAGDVAACRRWMRASGEGRGTEQDRQRVIALAGKLCERREDGWSCVISAMVSSEPSPRLIEILKRFGETPCDAAHRDRCEMPREPLAFGFSDSSSVEEADHRFDRAGCALGVLDACLRMKYASRKENADVFARLDAACDQGDAEACDAVERPLDPAALCAAHDYKACGIAGCLGDRAAAETALAKLERVSCDSGAVSRLTAKPVVSVANRLPFDSLEFHELSAKTAVPYYQIYNVSTRDLSLLIGAIYVYDAAGNQIARNDFELRRPLPSGTGTLLAVPGERGESFEPCIDVIQFDDDPRSRLGRCPARKARGARWGDGRDTVELHVALPEIPLGDAWTSKVEPALCEPFEQGHLGIRVRAIGGGASAVVLGSHWLTPDSLAKMAASMGPAVELPFVREPTTIAFRVAGIDDLQLSAPTLARIFQQQIVRWDDPAIAADNPQRALPPTPIVVLQDHGGSQQLRLTTYLAGAARGAWKLGVTRDAPFFEGVRRLGGDDLVNAVVATNGAIAYLGPGLERAAGLHTARIRNARGAFVAPTTDAITRGEYPLVASRPLYVFASHPDKQTAEAARAYAAWLLGDGLAIFERLGYGREPDAALRAGAAKLAAAARAAPAP